MSIDFSPGSPLGRQLSEWWQKLKDDSASRSELKRCNSATEVMMTPAFQRLCHQLKPCFEETSYWQERLAAVVGLAAHLKHENEADVLSHGKTKAEALAEQLTQDVGGRPLVSELRFRRLIQRNPHELYAPMLRILRILKGNTNLYSMAQSIFHWGDDIKKRWAFAYFPKVESRTNH